MVNALVHAGYFPADPKSRVEVEFMSLVEVVRAFSTPHDTSIFVYCEVGVALYVATVTTPMTWKRMGIGARTHDAVGIGALSPGWF